MNQLNGKYVNVVLSVEYGKGMDFLKNTVHITGNFCGRILESDQIVATERPPFNTELVWEVEKKELRKVRSANQPLRVECITTDPHNRKERVGFALLSLRSAQIVPLKSPNQNVNSKWYKLIGCQADKKQCHPELYMSLAVRDHLVNEVDTANSTEQMPYISEEEVSVADEILSSNFSVAYLDDGFIRIGNETDAMSPFSLNIFVKDVVNLDTLLPEILVFQQNREKFFLSFRILGVTIKTKPFSKELHNSIILNEKVVVKLLSNENALEEFFKSQNITVNFCCGQDKLGTTDIELSDVFTTSEARCFFRFPSPNGIVPFGCSNQSPFISIRVWMEQHGVPELEIDKEEKPKTKMVFSNLPRLPSCGGDMTTGAYLLDKLEKVNVKAGSDIESAKPSDTLMEPFVTKSLETVIRNIPLSPKYINPFDIYKKYVLEVSLKTMLWKKWPKDTKIIFKFLHPKASSYITILTEVSDTVGELIRLDNLTIHIVYISTENKVTNLLNAWPPKLVLLDEKEKPMNEEYEFSVELHSNHCADKDVLLKTIRTLEPLAKMQVAFAWNEYHLEEPDGNPNLTLYPAILDEVIAVREIIDIEQWKVKERDKFDDALEKIREREVNRLQQEWDKKKSTLEETLVKSVNKCKTLQQTLEDKLNSMKVEKDLRKIRNKNTNLYEEIFRENWKTYAAENTKEVIELLSKTQRDYENLKDLIKEQRARLDMVEKSSLTKMQTANLLKELRVLEEKFETAKNAKSYFKEQWKKACEEIHDLKREDILNMQNRIQKNKEELSQLSLDKFTSSPNDHLENFSPSSVMSARSSGIFF